MEHWTRETTATYVGGPLDGQTIDRGARWSLYRDDTGEKLSTGQGNAMFALNRRTPADRHYLHCLDHVNRRHVYVHATVIDAWTATSVVRSTEEIR